MSGEKLNEEQVSNLLEILRTDATIDTKVNLINQVKSGIKQNNVPDACIHPVFEATRAAMTSQQAAIVNAGFTTLGHLLSRISRQEPKYIAKEAGRTLPLVMEKMGDSKEKYRQLAAQCLTIFWNKAPSEVERTVKNTGLVNKNSRMKDSCMSWIVQTHQDSAMPFKNYVSALMVLLEDADGMVRDTARNSVIALFQNASNTAKTDLKKQLKAYNVRPTIVSAINAHLGPIGHVETGESVTTEIQSRSVFANSLPPISNLKGPTQIPEIKIEQLEPTYVNTLRELESTFQEMHPYFEGKESEQNWFKREQCCTTLRRLNAGNAPIDYHDGFLVGIKGLLDGILKAMNSLRTSLSKEGCSVIQEVTKTAGTGMDPMVEILLQNLIKLCGGTKKISSQQANVTVDVILSVVSYNIRTLQHIWAACQDKNVQPRVYATGWLKTMLKKEAHHKSHIEHSGGLDIVEKCIFKGLSDANPGVREKMRSTYWTYASIWAVRAEGIMNSLEPTQQKLLENAPENPNSPKKTNSESVRSGLGFSKSTSNPPKPSLKDTMLAQKKASLAHRNLPTRPGSAMSSFSPVRNTSNSSSNAEIHHSRHRFESTNVSHGGLSVAPMRPNKLKAAARSDLTTRPATAGPYAIRRPGHAPSHSETSTSPSTVSKSHKASTPSLSTPKRIPPRPSTSHSSHASQSSHTTPKKSSLGRATNSPRASPVRPKSSGADRSPSNRAANGKNEKTIIIPSTSNGSKQVHDQRNFLTANSCTEKKVMTPQKIIKDLGNTIVKNNENSENPSIYVDRVLELEEASTVKEIYKPDQDRPSEQDPPLLDSGIKKVISQSLDVHGFRKLQGIIRESRLEWTGNKAGILISGLFDYLEAPLISLPIEKKQDVKVQALATVRLMFQKDPDAFRPYIARGIESLLTARSAYDSRAHIVSGLEILSSDLIRICEPLSTISSILRQLQTQEESQEGYRSVSMGLHILKELLNLKTKFLPSEAQLNDLSELTIKCLSNSDSGVRMDAVHLCVAIHSKVGGENFWKVLEGMSNDPKSLITYYIVKQQKEFASSTALAV
ncbi:Protein stu-1 [Golovinomyces cichoracearum]|uniref:Protein stu-1 n=1 Tax=Golovinomyces cichoracearum TaxID=62708 RepID=A0A420HJB0_9PEZI|nr:Protein stu-1 [Golovinomyces cichoracearum]